MNIERLKPFTAEERKRFRASPCFLCGYNSRDYYQPATHPCARRYHATDAAYIVTLEDELSRLREVERRAKEVIRPFAENACGGDGNGFLDVPNEHAARFHDLSNPTSPTLLEGHFRAARDLYRALSEREGQDG